MRFLRFLTREFLLHGVVFALVGTIALTCLYLLSIGAPIQNYVETGRSFLLLVSGSSDFSTAHPGFSAGRIIASGAAITLPLALASLIIVIIMALSGAAFSVTSRFLANKHNQKLGEGLGKVMDALGSLLAAVPLFVGFWVLANHYGSQAPFMLIALATVVLGGLGWDAMSYLRTDMERQLQTTYADVFSTLGAPLGRFFPLPGSFSGYLFSSSLPRFIPYLAGKVSAIIGAVTIAEIVFSFPGLGSTLLESLLTVNTDLLVAAVLILLCVNAIVAFIVKSILYMIYPRWYEKSV